MFLPYWQYFLTYIPQDRLVTGFFCKGPLVMIESALFDDVYDGFGEADEESI